MQAHDRGPFSEGGQHLGKPGHSLALRYEMLLKELAHVPESMEGTAVGAENSGSSKRGGVTHARINTCFQILDELLPNLGVYQRVVRLLRDELYAAVYSREFTSAKGPGKRDPTAVATQPLPYFILAQKLMSKRGSDMSKLKTEIASLKEELYTCEADLEKASNALEAYRHDVKERDNKIHRLSSELRLCYAENERLQKVESQHQRAQDRLRQEAEFRILSFRNTVGSLKEDKAKLKVYKDTYDKLHDVYSSPHSSEPQKQPTTKATNKSELEQHIASAELLRKQLLTMQNSLIEEYDGWMNNLTVGEKQNTQILPAAVILNKQNFQRSIAEISTELSLLQDHSKCLSDRYVQVKGQRKAPPHSALVLPAHPDNPLVPQQQVTNKYAIMVYSSSDGGNSYYSLKEVQLCHSCGHQTVVCPHKAMRGDMIIQLPVNSTHLKISRPALTVTTGTTTTSKTRAHGDQSKGSDNDKQTTKYGQSPDFTKLWALFRAKYPDMSSSVPRTLTAEEVLSLTQQFYATLLNQDDSAVLGEDEQPTILMECLFQFLSKRFQVQDIAPQVIFDFLTALFEHQPQHMDLSVLCHLLCGQLDGSAFRYLLLLGSLIDLMPWSTIKEVSPFLAILYPFLQEEDIEQLTMNFIAHGSNKISKQLVMDYFVWLLLRHREPLVLMLESKLMEHPCNKPGAMLEVEFADAMEGLVPLVSDQLCRRLFLQSLAQYKEDHQTKRETLPMKRLSYIAAYLRSLSLASSLKVKMEELAATCTVIATQPAVNTSTGGYVLVTMETVRTIAGRIKAISFCN